MRASTPIVPHVPAVLIPLLDAALPRTGPPRRLSRAELEEARGRVEQVADDFGARSPVTLRCLLVLGIEYARAEVLL